MAAPHCLAIELPIAEKFLIRAASRLMSIEYFVVCTAGLPERRESWNAPFGPVSIASLPTGNDVRLQLEARLDGTDVTGVVHFSSRAGAGHLAFQFATALAKMASGVVFDEESLDEPLADYRGYPAVMLSGGIEVIWQMTIQAEQRAEQLRARREAEEHAPLRARSLSTDEDWTDSLG